MVKANDSTFPGPKPDAFRGVGLPAQGPGGIRDRLRPSRGRSFGASTPIAKLLVGEIGPSCWRGFSYQDREWGLARACAQVAPAGDVQGSPRPTTWWPARVAGGDRHLRLRFRPRRPAIVVGRGEPWTIRRRSHLRSTTTSQAHSRSCVENPPAGGPISPTRVATECSHQKERPEKAGTPDSRPGPCAGVQRHGCIRLRALETRNHSHFHHIC